MNVLNCLGVSQVMCNKETNTHVIQVNLPKDFPSQDGENTATAEESKTDFTSTSGNQKTGNVLLANTVPATWLSLNSHRVSAPDVRVGSRVVLYQFMNDNKYYWTTFGLDGTFRLETVIYAISASPNINENTPITPDNYYIFTISSHQKKIEFLSGQGNGEALGYQFTLNLQEGWFGSMDSDGNMLVVNGPERSLTYNNVDKTQLSINKKDFTLVNEGDSTIQSTENFTVKSKNITLIADEQFTLQTKTAQSTITENQTVRVGGNQTTTVNGSDTHNITGDTTFNTPTLNASEAIHAGTNIDAGVSIAAPSVKAGGAEVTGHIHGNGNKGQPTAPLGG